jgi:hypothetical protein
MGLAESIMGDTLATSGGESEPAERGKVPMVLRAGGEPGTGGDVRMRRQMEGGDGSAIDSPTSRRCIRMGESRVMGPGDLGRSWGFPMAEGWGPPVEGMKAQQR